MKPVLLTNRDRRDWDEFCSGWPHRLLQAADTAFAMYATAPNERGTREEFEALAAAADKACKQYVSRRDGRTTVSLLHEQFAARTVFGLLGETIR